MRQNRILEQSCRFQIKLLGTPSLSWEEKPFSLSRKQARALIYVLGSTLQPVSRDRLIFLFWPDKPEATARRNLTRVLSYIRKTLPHPEIILFDKASIGLNPELVWSDAVHFSGLIKQNSPASKSEIATLYDGLFLSGFSLSHNSEFDSWLTTQQGKYEGGYLAALKDLIQSNSADQDYAAAIDFAQRYLVIDELAEDVHQHLIRLYAVNGDRGAAMRQFEACTLILERELGVEALPETRKTYDEARSGKTSFQPVLKIKPSWTVLPSLDLPLIGREKAWESLENAYRQFQHGGVILLSGEPGVGKSRLLQEFATSRDRLVLSGNCHASTQTLSYQPITQALRQALSQPGLWAGTRPIWLTETSRLLPELVDTFPDLPPPIEVEPDQAQARLYEALTQCVLGLARNTTLLLCLDDLQWMDRATAGWLTYLSSRLAGSNICILAAYRIEEKNSVEDLQETISRINLMVEISLTSLTQEAIGLVLGELLEPPFHPDTLAARIYSATGGNTFFVLETIRVLLERGQLASPPFELPLANTVQEVIQRRLNRLSQVARQILEAAAVLSPDLQYQLMQETAGRSELEVADGLDELTEHQLLIGGDPHRIRHDLITQITYQSLSPWRKRLLHRRAADSLDKLYRQQPDEVAALIARHYDAAGELKKAVHYYHKAAIHARRLYANEEAIIYMGKALELSSKFELDWKEIAQFHEFLGESLKITGQFEAARQVYSNCLDLIPDSAYLQCVKFQTKLADVFENLNLMDQAEQTYDKALMLLKAHLDDHQTLAWQQAWLEVHLERLGMLYLQAKPEVMDAVCEEIKPVLEKTGTPDQRARYYASQVSIALLRERFALSRQTLRFTDAELKAVMETGDTARIATAKFQWGFRLLWSGNLDAAEQPLYESLRIAEETGRVMLQCRCLIYLTCLHRLQGDVESARTYAVRSFEGAQYLNSVTYIGAAYSNLAWLDWRDQQFDQAVRQAQKALSVWGETQYPFKWLAYWVLLVIYLDRDQLDKAIESINAMLDLKQQRLPDDLTAALEQSVLSWEENQVNTTRDALIKAVELAKGRGYL